MKPCIPDSWDEYSIRYKYGDSVYNIKVINKKSKEKREMFLNGEKIDGEEIPLQNDGKVNNVEIVI